MITKVQKWGNSQGVRLSKELLSGAHINVGDALDLRELVKRMPKNDTPHEFDWGHPVGREVW